MAASKITKTNTEVEVDKSTQPFAVERTEEPHHQGSIEDSTPEPPEDRTEPGAPRRKAGAPGAAAAPAAPQAGSRSALPFVALGVILLVIVLGGLGFAMSGGANTAPKPPAPAPAEVAPVKPAPPPVPAEVTPPTEVTPPVDALTPTAPEPAATPAATEPPKPTATPTPAKPATAPAPVVAAPAPVEAPPTAPPEPVAPKGGVLVSGEAPVGLVFQAADGTRYTDAGAVPPGSYTLQGAWGTDAPHGLGSIVVADGGSTIKCSSVIGQCSAK